MKRKITLLVFGGLMFASGCASTYHVQSKPDNARVYFIEPGTERKVYLGATPLTYSKNSLPQDRAFSLAVAKDGFKTQEVPMASTDETRTVVSVTLKPDEDTLPANAREMNDVVRKLFAVQELIYRRELHSAIIEADKILKERPQLVQAYVMKGTAYYLLNEMAPAMDAWTAALRLNPADLDLKSFVEKKRVPASLTEKRQ